VQLRPTEPECAPCYNVPNARRHYAPSEDGGGSYYLVNSGSERSFGPDGEELPTIISRKVIDALLHSGLQICTVPDHNERCLPRPPPDGLRPASGRWLRSVYTQSECTYSAVRRSTREGIEIQNPRFEVLRKWGDHGVWVDWTVWRTYPGHPSAE